MQVKTTTRSLLDAKSFTDQLRPSVPGRVKSGAGEPKGRMVGTASEAINEQVENTTAKREARMARFMVAKVELMIHRKSPG